MKNILLFASLLLLVLQSSTHAQENTKHDEDRQITIKVDVQPDLMPTDIEEWVLYVYATKQGQRLPLSNFKGKLSQLPSEIVLHQSMYLLPHLTLAQADNVVIIAKATKNKNPHQRSVGDIIGYSAPVSFINGTSQQATVIINQHDKANR